MSVPARPDLRDGDVALRRDGQAAGPAAGPAAGVEGSDAVSFVVEHQSQVAGTVSIRAEGGGSGELSWAVHPDHRGQGVTARAVRLLIRYAFDELGLHRVAAYPEPHDRASLRTAGRAGLRREGVVRAARPIGVGDRADGAAEGERAGRRDRVQLARLATDPEPTSRDGFIGVLNAGLPTKRAIAQGLIRNNAGEILLCALSYKNEWDLPGGVVDPQESPAHAVVREIREELDIAVVPQSLLAVNWLPSWRGWDDAVLFVFDLGVADDVIARASLEPHEIRSLHWCTLDDVERRAAPYVTRLLRRLAQHPAGTAYLEDGSDPGW